MRVIVTILMLLNITSVSWAAQDRIQAEIHSESLAESRPILVRLPADYANQPDKNFPVLITLNEKDNFNWASSIVDIQAAKYGIEDMIVVGLPSTGNYSDDNYPFKNEESAELSPQAQKYSAFIRKEALPYIEKNYRTNGGRFIVGHSLSGLFVANMLMQHPNAFSSYVMLSPSMQYAPQLPELLRAFFKQHASLSSSVYLALGDMEHQKIRHGFEALEKVFVESAPANLAWTVNYMANTDHMLSAFKGTYDSLAWIYADWHIRDTEMQTYITDDYIEHYKKLSKKLKYQIKPRERYIAGFSGFAASQLDDKHAAEQALKAGIYFYPESQALKEQLKDLDE